MGWPANEHAAEKAATAMRADIVKDFMGETPSEGFGTKIVENGV